MAAHRTRHQDVRVGGTGRRRGGGRFLRRGLSGRGLLRRGRLRRALGHDEIAAEARDRFQQAGQRVPFTHRLLDRLGRRRGQARPLPVVGTVERAVQRTVARQPRDPRDERKAGLRRGEVLGLADQRARLLVDGLDEPPGRVVRPARRVRFARDPVDQQDFPGAVVAAPGVPLHGVLLGAAQQQSLLDGLAELGSRGVLTGPADRGLAGPLGHEGALGQHGALEATDAVDGDARHLRDFLGRGTRAYTRLDVAGAEMALHLDLDLAEAGTVAAHGGAEPFVNRKRVLRAVRSLQHQPCAVIGDGHDTQFGHGDLPGGACRRHVRRCFR